jgi:protein-disulfide isomerase
MDQKLSTNMKLYILLGISGLLFVVFFVAYVKDYVFYYQDLYSFRSRLIEQLQPENVQKPVLQRDDPVKGNPQAKIVIFEYGDFSCEGCFELQSVLTQLEQFYGSDNILLVWKDLPVTLAPNNIFAHEAAHCAYAQGSFFTYKKLLYETQASFDRALFLELARQLNLDGEAFARCIDQRSSQGKVQNNFTDALQLGLDSTPTLFINNVEVQSGFNFQNLRNIIESTK